LGESMVERGTFDDAAIVLDEASQLARAIDDEPLEARAELVRYHLSLNSTGSFGDTTLAVDTARRYVDVFEAAGDTAGLARAWRVIANIHVTVGRYDLAAEEMQRVIKFASELGDTRLGARGAIMYGYSTLHSQIPVAEALPRCEEYLVLTGTDRNAEAIMLGVVAVLKAMRGAFVEARALCERSRELISELGASVTAASTSLEASRVEMLAGSAAGAEDVLRRDYDTLEAIGETYLRSTVAALLGSAIWELGRFDEAERYAGVSRDIADEDDVLSQVLWRGVMAKGLARRGDSSGALALATRAVELAAGTVDIELRADALVALADVLGSLGRHEEAEPRLREALALYDQKGDVVMTETIGTRVTAPVTH